MKNQPQKAHNRTKDLITFLHCFFAAKEKLIVNINTITTITSNTKRCIFHVKTHEGFQIYWFKAYDAVLYSHRKERETKSRVDLDNWRSEKPVS